MAGLEPARIAPPPPQGGVYTNFTTSALFFNPAVQDRYLLEDLRYSLVVLADVFV